MPRLRIGIGRTPVNPAETWLLRVPFSIYLGWITVATVANVTSLLDYLGWGGFGIAPEVWAVIMLGIATVLGVVMMWREGDVAYVLVLVWAFIGISNSQADTALVANAAWLGSALLIIAIFLIALLRRRST